MAGDTLPPLATDAEIDAAIERGLYEQAAMPHARSAYFDRVARRIVIDLTSGCTFSFLPSIVQGLEDATDDDLRQVDTGPTGYGLLFPTLAIDLSVHALTSGMFGSRPFMEARIAAEIARLRAEAGRAGDASRSEAKRVSSRANGAKAGRPKKVVG